MLFANPITYVRKLFPWPKPKTPSVDEENPPESALASPVLATLMDRLPVTSEIPENQGRPPYLRRNSSTLGIKNSAYRPRAPNMSLNISPDQERADLELHCAAIVGIFCQCAVLVVAALLSYYPPWIKGKFLGASKGSKPYAFPLTAAGSVAVFVGLFLCTRVVESASTEKKWAYEKSQSTDYDSEASSIISSETAHGTDTGADETKPGIRCMWVQVRFTEHQ